ncbi:hypothetical protein OG203_30255 [Nocardia sp. NBC_01499]|uniref:hypothetical protein n=1 Tax=Nocardia sp. NBC_01499 TaxID=2903597 RepID=UPI00386531B6
MGDGYSRDRDQVPNHERGKIFENGTDRFFRDRESGYTQGSRKYEFRDKGGRTERIQFDKIRNEQDRSRTDSVEEKSGRIEGRKDEKQLRGVRELLNRGEINRHILRSVEGESISKECQELINGLKRDFPDRFTHLKISRTDARAIWAIGKDLERGKQVETPERGKQLELPGVGEKAREAKAQEAQKQRDKQAALAKARGAKEKFQAVQRFSQGAELGRAEAPQRVQAERAQQAQERAERAKTRETPQAERDRATRAAGEKGVREFQDRLKPGPEPSAGKAPEKSTPERESPEAARARVEREAQDRVLREFPFPVPSQSPEQETPEVGERATPELGDAASVEREAADKARVAQREAADKALQAAQERSKALEQNQLQGLSPEVRNLLALGQAQPPTAAVETKPGYAPGVERGGTGQTQGRDRGQSRDR